MSDEISWPSRFLITVMQRSSPEREPKSEPKNREALSAWFGYSRLGHARTQADGSLEGRNCGPSQVLFLTASTFCS